MARVPGGTVFSYRVGMLLFASNLVLLLFVIKEKSILVLMVTKLMPASRQSTAALAAFIPLSTLEVGVLMATVIVLGRTAPASSWKDECAWSRD